MDCSWSILITSIAALIGFYYVSTLPQHISNHETLVLGQNVFSPGSKAAMRVVVNDSANRQPPAGC